MVIVSFFGYAVTSKLTITNSIAITEFSVADDPLIGLSDAIVYCGIDGSALHEFYLCGTNDQRALNLNIPDAQQIIWYKLEDGSCSESSPDCPNTSIGCQWDQLSSNTQFTIDSEGEYRVNIQYSDGTSGRHYFNVYTNGLNPSAVVHNIDCNGPGSITVNNVPANYEFSINNGINWIDSNIFSVSATGTYDILIRRNDNTAGCEFSVEDIIVNNESINATPTVNEITCNNSKGSIQIDVADASATYVYTISQGGSTVNTSGPTDSNSYIFDNLNAGNYDIEVSLANVSSCTWTYAGSISNFTPIEPNVVVSKNIDCAPGVITVSQSGGSAPFEYSLTGKSPYVSFTSGNQTSIDIATAGTYTVTVRDNNGCQIDGIPVDVVSEPEITYDVVSKDVSCNGVDDGSITISVLNNQGYSVTYSNDGGSTFQNSKIFSNLSAGTYAVVIKKEKAGSTCFLDHGDITINPNVTFTVEGTVTQKIDCTTGFATLEAMVTTGGTSPFAYSLDGTNFQSDPDFTNLGAGEYTITVRDANTCLATDIITIDAGSNATDITFAVTNTNCTTGTSEVLLTVEGGISSPTYEITAPTAEAQTSPDNTFIDLVPGTYTFQVTSDDGCKIVRNYTVPSVSNLEVNATVKTNVSCFDSTTPDGSIDLTVNNFDTSYDFSIVDSSGSTSPLGQTGVTSNTTTVTGLAAEIYTITVSDATGSCPISKVFEIKAPTSEITVGTPTVSNINCGSPGSITIDASGGWGNYTYSVIQPDNTVLPVKGQTGKTINGLSQLGLHTVIVKDINGCINDTQTFTLADNGGPTVAIDYSLSNYCYSSSNLGELKINITSGTAPFYYTLNNGATQNVSGTSFTLNGLTPDDYQLKVIGSNGCETLVDDTKISGQLFATASITKPLGCGTAPDAIIEVTAQQGYPDPDYIYEVSTDGGASYAPATMPFSTSVATTYQFRVEDSKGCETLTDPVVVTVAPNLIINPIITDTTCGLEGTGAVNLEVTGGTGPFEYSLDGGVSFFANQPVFNNLDALSYDYVVRDNLGCEMSGIITIGAADPPSFTLDLSDKDIECPATLGGAMQWGTIYVTDPINAVAPYSIRLRFSNGRAIRTYNNVDPNATANQDGSGNFSFDIRMFWTRTLYVEVEDARGCIYTSDSFTVTQPELPVTHSGPALEADGVTPIVQSCANGSPIFDLEITNAAELIGPFRYRIWPLTLVDSDDDGNFDDYNDYEPFDTPSNLHPNYVAGTTGNRAMRFGAPQHDLLFGVSYRVIIYDEGTGCYRWSTLGEIEIPSPGLDITVQRQSLSCRSGSDGEMQINVTNHDQTANLDYEITVAGNPTNIIQNGSVSGAGASVSIPVSGFGRNWYVVAVTDGSGCTTAERVYIDRPKSALRLNITSNVKANCFVGAQVTVNGTGGWNSESYYQSRNAIDNTWTGYEYAFVPDGNTFDPDTDAGYSTTNSATLDPNVEDTYTVYVRDAGGCYVSEVIIVTKAVSPEITAIDVPDRCSSTNELYTVNATIIDGEGTNTYIWDGEVTNAASATLGPGNHTLTVRDANGCTDTENIFLYPQMITNDSNVLITQPEFCNSPNNGEIEIIVYGGSQDYLFERLDTAETNSTGIFSGLTDSINYTFSVTDNQSGCAPQMVSITLDEPEIPNFEARVLQQVSCNGGSNGSIIVEQTAGAENTDVTYEYSLNGGTYQSSNLFEGLSQGTDYTISVKSSKNCVQTIVPDITITEPAAISINASATSFECASDNSLGLSTITANASDGTGPYIYSFDGSSYSSDNTFKIPFKNVAQTVLVEVLDANNCTNPTPYTITVDAATKLEATISETQPMNCKDDAIFDIDIRNGSGNYTLSEIPGTSAEASVTGITVTIGKGNPGTYVFEIYDTTTKCSTEVSYTTAPFDGIEVANVTKIRDLSCQTFADGEFVFQVSGFSTSFSYEVFERDNATIAVRTSLNETSTADIVIDVLPAGIYYAVITDDDTGCFRKSESITIQSPSIALDFDWEFTQEIRCNPVNAAEVVASGRGGWGNYEFEFTNKDTGAVVQNYGVNNVFGNLESGVTYTIALKDGNGCDNVTKDVLVPLITPITVDNNPIVVQPSCFGISDASITVSATGGQGTAFYQYVLNNLTTGVSSAPQGSATFSNLMEGEYTVSVLDNIECNGVLTPSIQIANPSEVEIDGFISLQPTCLSQGEITVNAIGGSGNFEYRIISPVSSDMGWSTQTVYPLDAGTYEFIARDTPNNCTSPISVIRKITAVRPLAVAVDDTNTTINCYNETDAVLIADATGGLGGYQYQLEVNGTLTGSLQDSEVFENLGAGTYRIFATGGLECETYSDPVTISNPAELKAELGSTTGIQCFGEETGSVEINVTNGEAPFTYIISSQPSKAVDTPKFENLSAGDDYFVIVQDKNGCEVLIEDIAIAGPTAALEAEVVRVENEVCSSDDNGLIEIEITGGTAPYSYNLTNPTDSFDSVTGTNLILDPLDGGDYIINIRDANGCETLLIQQVVIGSNLSATIVSEATCADGAPLYNATVVLDDMENINLVFGLDDIDPYNTDFANYQTSLDFENLSPGDHTISIFDSTTGCIEVVAFTIEAQKELVLMSQTREINEIFVQADGGDGNYTYYFDDIPQTDGIYYINASGEYHVKVIDGKGCEAEIFVPMEFIDIEIPNFFTPNGDGKNDTWVIKNVEGFPNMHVTIFDRSGRKLKEFLGQGEWDGSYNKDDLPTGDYWYIIRLNGRNDLRQFMGHFSVYR